MCVFGTCNERCVSGAALFLSFPGAGGRDLVTFKTLGHRAVGLDGSAAFCELARHAAPECEVWHQDFVDLELRASRVIVAGFYFCASFVVSRRELSERSE